MLPVLLYVAGMKYSSPRSVLSIAAGLMIASSACGAAARIQPARHAPHGVLEVSITHASTRELYDDVLLVDGQGISVGEGRGGTLALRVAPGAHRLVLSSRKLDYVLETGERTNPFGQCMSADCGVFAPETISEIRLAEMPGPICERAIDLTFHAGTSQALTLSVDFETCEMTVDGKQRGSSAEQAPSLQG